MLNQWRGDAPEISQVNTVVPASVTIGNIFTLTFAAVLQVEYATIVGTIGPSGAGNATVIVTAAGMSNSPKTVSVAVANNDSASTVAGKVRTALGLDADVSAFFTVGGSGANYTLTAKAAAGNDGTMNVSSANGTCSGLTAVPNSVHAVAGSAGRSVSYTALVATVADVTAGLVAAVAAANILEANELTLADNTTNVTLTASTAGKPFTQTSSAATGAGSGGCTLATTATTANSGPNDYSVASNWTLGALPASTHDVLLDDSNVSILWNLPSSPVTVASHNRTGTYTGQIGLPLYDANGYFQYRQRFWMLYAPVMNLGNPGLSGPGLEMLYLANNAPTLNVNSCGSPTQPGQPALVLKGTGAGSLLNVLQGQIGVAIDVGDLAALADVRIGNDGNLASDATLYFGAGVTHSGTVKQYGGTLNTEANLATVDCVAGTLSLQKSAAITTAINATRKATVNWLSNGTIAGGFLADSNLDNTLDQRAKTCSAMMVAPGYSIADPGARIVWSTGIQFAAGCGIDDGTLDVGDGRLLTIT